MRITFPSKQFPGYPAISLMLPEGWEPVSAPAAVLAARRRSLDNEFSSNILITLTRHTGTDAIAEAVEDVRAAVKDRESAEVGELFDTKGAGWFGSGFDSALVYPEVGTLVRVDLIAGFLHAETSFVDVVHFVGTMAANRTEIDYPAVQSIAKSMELTGPSEDLSRDR